MGRGVRGLCVVFVFLFALMPLATSASRRTVLQAEGDGESRETPYGVGQTGKVGGYELTVLELTPDATEMVLGENSFNEPPEQGNVFVIARVEATYTGRETGEPGFDLRFNVVGDQNRGYSESQADCGVIPDEAYDAPELFPGGAAEFNVCWSVPEEEVDSLVMYVEAGFSDERVWFSLRDEAPSSVDSQDDGASAEQTEDEQPVDESSDTLAIEAGDLFFEPSDFEVSPGGTITVTNIGVLPHDFAVDEWGGVLIGPLEANESGQYTVPDDAQPGDIFTFYCSIPGHKEAGMTGTLTIVDASSAESEETLVPTEDGQVADADSGGSTIAIEAGDIYFEPRDFEVAPGDTILLNNTGVLPHDMAVDEWGGVIIGPLDGGESGEYTVPEDVEPGDTFTFYCSIPGHSEAGMEGTITIVSPPPISTPDASPIAISSVPTVASPMATPVAPSMASPVATPMASPVLTETTVKSDEGFFSGATVMIEDEVERYVWDERAGEIEGFGLTPVSLTVGNFEGSVRLFAEFANSSSQPILAPTMLFDASYNGTSFGIQSIHAFQYQVAPGESIFYDGIDLYRGAILYGDWTDFEVTFEGGTAWGDEYSTMNLRLVPAEGRIYNDGSHDAANVSLQGIGRDTEGVYSGVCSWERIEATIPAGLFVRVPESVSATPGASTSCDATGDAFAARLGTSPVRLATWIAVIPKP